MRTFALPLGIWPKNRALAERGSWHDPKSGRDVPYSFDAILEVAGPSAPSPFTAQFKPFSLPRVQMNDDELEKELDRLDTGKQRFVAGAASKKVAGSASEIGHAWAV